ncbi:MAG: diaminopimelate decarboxylase [Bacillaceae bacterium]|nr:diaminopimelate decarboxylase [Bacillaceae bacterium]
MFLHGTSKINENGHLEIGGCDTVELAEQFGTPLYVYDEQLIREKAREFVRAFEESGFAYQVAYASKAFSTIAMCELAAEEGLSLDVVSGGELYTALKAGYPADKIHFHGNNKSQEEIAFALDENIGCFVVDNFLELELLHQMAAERNQQVNILLRLTPGIEAHTHEYISTGQEDSKFGFTLSNGHALKAIETALDKSYYRLLGIHSHIGSQIFDSDGFIATIHVLFRFLMEVREKTGFEAGVLNLGGGFGIRYTEEDTPLPVSEHIQAMTKTIRSLFEENDYPLPEVWIEPGRSIVGEAGTTLYTVGSIKDIPGIRKYVAVNGGMTDNLRPALYQAKYEALLANRAGEEATEQVSIAGRCCETGDMLIHDIELPEVRHGDILAVLATGAYGYSMSNNYNRFRRPAVVFVKDGRAELVVKRETYDDITRNDCSIKNTVSSK